MIVATQVKQGGRGFWSEDLYLCPGPPCAMLGSLLKIPGEMEVVVNMFVVGL